MNATLDFLEAWALADCAAQVLAADRPKAFALDCEGARVVSAHSRYAAVTALRTLWKQADRDARRTISARVHVWLQTGRAERFAKATNLGGVTR
jgi:hypothetical protein